jgi:hypothetical protein
MAFSPAHSTTLLMHSGTARLPGSVSITALLCVRQARWQKKSVTLNMQNGCARWPTEVECGSHYARSMASYGLFTGICGFEYHGPKGYIAFSPGLRPENFRAPFTSAAGWGTFSQKRVGNTQTEKLEVKWGRLRLKTLAFDLPDNCKAGNVSVKCAGRTVKANFEMKNNRVVIILRNDVKIQHNEAIEVEITFSKS